jgi:hypothetical protein
MKQRNDWHGAAFSRRSVNPLEWNFLSCSLIALAASAQSKEAKVPRSVAPFELEYAVAKTGLEYARRVHPFSVAVEKCRG